jgi:hypothetical protein
LVAIAITSVPLIFAPTIPVMAVAALLAWTTTAIGRGIALGSANAGGLIETYGPNKALILTTAAGVAATPWLPRPGPDSSAHPRGELETPVS